MSATTASVSNRTALQRVGSRIAKFTNDRDIAHEVLVISISYVFVGRGAWNDGLLGFTPSPLSHFAELTMALVLSLKIASRLRFTLEKSARFWFVLILDALSVLTVLPGLLWISFARLARVLYAGGRLVILLDRISCKTKNPMWLVILYPFIVPLVAAVVLASERSVHSSTIHNYLQALSVCFAFALSLGNVRPESPFAMGMCGVLFLLGIICIGVFTNAISARYLRDD